MLGAMTSTRMRVQQGDITTLAVDAIVNAANEHLLPGGGVCGAIHAAAGPGLAEACAEIGACPTGEARATPGFDLPARHVVHAVGPVWHGGGRGEASLLASCYRSALAEAARHGARTIAFPCISTGIFGYPREEAAAVAVATVAAYLAVNDLPEAVVFCTYGDADTAVMEAALPAHGQQA